MSYLSILSVSSFHLSNSSNVFYYAIYQGKLTHIHDYLFAFSSVVFIKKYVVQLNVIFFFNFESLKQFYCNNSEKEICFQKLSKRFISIQ